MNTPILNRNSSGDFQHPADGWYHIEAKGDHPNRPAKIIQIIDDKSCENIVNRFNALAAAPNFPGLLIDHEHFSSDDDKETIAYGWLMKLQNRADGIYGQIRWTDTGKKAVDGGDYRFFSTEYPPKDFETVNNKSPREVRPLALAGLTLTNVPNNKGQKPITNREPMEKDKETSDDNQGPAAVAATKSAQDASENSDTPAQHEKAAVAHRKAEKLQGKCGNDTTAEYHGDMADMHDSIAERMRSGVKNRQFPTGRAGAEQQQTETQNAEPMKDIIKLLGLAADASEQDAVTAITKIKNRSTELQAAQLETDLETYATRIPKDQQDFIREGLVTNRQRTIDFLEALPEIPERNSPARVANRGASAVHVAGHDAGGEEEEEATIRNRRNDAIAAHKAAHPRSTHESATNAVRNRNPELFGQAPRA